MVISFLQRHPKITAGHIRAEDNLGAMLLEILELYGTRFNFDRVGIAVDHGGSYFHKGGSQYSNYNVWKKICIRDPNDPLNNVAKASFQVDNIVRVFGDAYRNLSTRCYLVHARMREGGKAPWGTMCGSLLDAIIERPGVAMRERLQRVWNPNMSKVGEEEGDMVEEAVREVDPGPTKGEIDRAAQQTAQQLTKKEKREKKKLEKEKEKLENRIQNGDQERPPDNSSNISLLQRITTTPPPPPPRTPKKKKTASDKRPRSPAKSTPIPPNDSSGTRDAPIILDSPAASPGPESRRARHNSSKGKRKRASANGADAAAANLTARGSTSGESRETITID
jgi:DNA polymerase sigma